MYPYRQLYRFSVFLTFCTLILITLGGLVHSTGSGLSVPDWPTTYGQNMFTYPISKWTGGIKYEHGHRLFASFVGFLVIIELFWVWIIEKNKSGSKLRKVAIVSLIAVCLQGILGGLTVQMQLPTAVSASHGMLAQLFLILTVILSIMTSRWWSEVETKQKYVIPFNFKFLFGTTFIFTFIQIFLGALTRHTYSGMAIPDFPLAYGKIIPDFSLYNYQVVIHYCHRVGALILTILTTVQLIKVYQAGTTSSILRFSTAFAAVLIIIQITLGGLIIVTVRDVIPNTAHVAVGSFLLIANTITFIFSFRIFEVEQVKNDNLFTVSSQI